jgi:hypothetical protein
VPFLILQALDNNSLTPPVTHSESFEALDEQAAWLAEQLTAAYPSKSPPFALHYDTYFIYANGSIEKYHTNNQDIINYCFVDNANIYHVLGTFERKQVPFWVHGKATKQINDLVDVRNLQVYQTHSIRLQILKWNAEQNKRYFVHPDVLAALLGAMAENNITDLRFNGASKADGSAYPSKTHYNGLNIDVGYLRKDQTGSSCLVTDSALDLPRQTHFNESLYKFGFARIEPMLSDRRATKPFLLPYTRAHPDHTDHLHIQGFDNQVINHFYPTTGVSLLNHTVMGNIGVLKSPQVSMPFDMHKSNRI